MNIYIIRHGQTNWNKDSRWQGCKDVELDEVGLEQAKRVAARLKASGITKLYSSPLKRARVTAEAIGEELGLQPFFRDDLKEVSLGEWEGLQMNTVKELYAEQLGIWETEPDKEVGLGVESYSKLRDRAVAAVRSICTSHKQGDIIAIVTHGAWTRAFLLYVLNIPMDKRLCFDIDNTGISVVRYDFEKERFKVRTLNECSHVD